MTSLWTESDVETDAFAAAGSCLPFESEGRRSLKGFSDRVDVQGYRFV